MVEENEKKKINDGYVSPDDYKKDFYFDNMKWLLDAHKEDFENNENRIRFRLNVVMQLFGDEDIKPQAFVTKQRSRLFTLNNFDKDNTNWLYTCGLDGKDKKGNDLYYYNRTKKEHVENRLFSHERISNVPESELEEESKEEEVRGPGGVRLKSDILTKKGLETEE